MGDEVDVIAASIHLWGDIDCDDAVDPIDTLKTLRYDAGLTSAQAQDCPLLGSDVQIVN
ncbi:MAG TPA: hypothetical protein VMR52_09220 [Dehalococcoidia bacterium]|nr:hypothetical protein [Dehalococcoidia bacterium]